jgi:exonuclease SbcD
VEEKSELELFREFYELQNNQSMTAQQKALVEELLRGMKA